MDRHPRPKQFVMVLLVVIFAVFSGAAAKDPATIALLTEPIVLTPGPGAEWKLAVTLAPGPYVLEINYGKGGIVNEGYPGFPPTPYSPYEKGRGSDRVGVWFDGKLIVQAVLPPMPPQAGLARQALIPFVCESAGEHELKLVVTLHSDEQRLEINAVALVSGRRRPVPHTLSQPRPTRPLMDAISWNEYVFYTVPPGLGPDDVLTKTLRPSWKAGLNLIWTVLNSPKGTVPFPWDEKAIGMPAPESFPWDQDKRWQVEGYRRYLGHLRDRNMMEMLYWPGGSPGVPKELQEIVQPGEKASSIRFFDTIYNSLDYEQQRLSDGISNERYCATENSLKGSRELAVAHVNQILQTNPGAFAVNYISGVDSARPGMLGDMPNGLEPYSSGYFQGFEDSMMFASDAWLLRVDGGKKYRWIEFWTEDGELVPKEKRAEASTWWRQKPDAPDNYFGGRIGEDFIVKQMNDVARMRLLNPDSFDALTGVTWYNDGMFVSDVNVEMVHAVSQDPVRGAVAGRLRTLGQGGPLRSLYPYTKGSHFLQNNYLALFFPVGKPHGELFYDLQRTGHFTPFSHRVAMAPSFLSDPGPATETSVVSRILERGAYRAVVHREVEVRSDAGSIKQRRTYTMISDTPYFSVAIDEQVEGKGGSLVNTLSGAGFDQLIVDGDAVKDAGSVSLPHAAVLRDSGGLRPDVVFLFLAAPRGSSLEWKPNQSLWVKRPAAEPLRMAVVVPTDLYTSDQFSALAMALSGSDPELKWKDGPMAVSNVASVPLTRSVALRGADDRPYLVKEGDWWTFRGAQTSKSEEKTDILKLYLSPGEKATILPWGFIEGAVQPGWGCQYVLAIGAVQATSSGAKCRVKILNETPMVFAPRVEFAFPVAGVRLDGKPWHYFEGRNVFLPQSRGEYDLRVEKHEVDVETPPHLSRTYLNVRSTGFTDNELSLEADAPPWRPKIPKGVRMTAQIEHPGRTLIGVVGGQAVRKSTGKSVIQIAPGVVRMQFETPRSSK